MGVALSKANAQGCYTQLDDASGYDRSSSFYVVEDAACRLLDSLPSELRDSFGIYGFGFYRLVDHYSDYSYDQIFEEVIEDKVDKPYYIIFGRESGKDGIYTKYHLAINLPLDDCLGSKELEGFLDIKEVQMTNQMDSPSKWASVESGMMYELEQFYKGIYDCCYNSPFKSFTPKDITLEITSGSDVFTFTDQPPKETNPNPYPAGFTGHPIGIIDKSPKMPSMSFRILDESCSSFDVALEVKYERPCPGRGVSRSRNDLWNCTKLDVKTNQYYSFELDQWCNFGGGRGTLILMDTTMNDTIGTYYFSIKGENPDYCEVMCYLRKIRPTGFWFSEKLGAHESGTDRRKKEFKQFNSHSTNSEELHQDWLQSSRCPNWGKPCGWGIFQIDKIDVDGQPGIDYPDPNLLWDWRANCDMFITVASVKIREAKKQLKLILEDLKEWQQRVDSDQSGELYNSKLIPSVSEGGYTIVNKASKMWDVDSDIKSLMDEVFSSYAQLPEVSWLDAFFMKRYNGTGDEDCRPEGNKTTGDYVYWTNKIIRDTIYLNPQDSSQMRIEQRKNLYIDERMGTGNPCEYHNYVKRVLEYKINPCKC